MFLANAKVLITEDVKEMETCLAQKRTARKYAAVNMINLLDSVLSLTIWFEIRDILAHITLYFSRGKNRQRFWTSTMQILHQWM